MSFEYILNSTDNLLSLINKSNIAEVKQTVERVKSGVVMKDILDCYPGIGMYEYVL